MQPNLPSLHVIVPCYNPPEGWEQALAQRFQAFQAAVEGLVHPVGLVVVNDGSSRQADAGNAAELKKLVPGAVWVSYPLNRGKGYALRQGVQQSNTDLHLVTDTDFPYTFDSMRKVVETLVVRGGIAAGNRDERYYDQVPPFRRWLSKALRWLLRHVLRQPITDSQCGLKAFDNAGKKIFLDTTIDRFLFDLEFLMLANGKISITPVPVDLRPGVVFSKVGYKVLLHEGGNFIRLLLGSRR